MTGDYSVPRLDLGTNTEREEKINNATTPLLRCSLPRSAGCQSSWSRTWSATHFSVCLPTAVRSHARSGRVCPVTNVRQGGNLVGTGTAEPRPRSGLVLRCLHQTWWWSHALPGSEVECDRSSLPACVVSAGGGGTAEVHHKVDPRHSIILSAFKWKFHKF